MPAPSPADRTPPLTADEAIRKTPSTCPTWSMRRAELPWVRSAWTDAPEEALAQPEQDEQAEHRPEAEEHEVDGRRIHGATAGTVAKGGGRHKDERRMAGLARK